MKTWNIELPLVVLALLASACSGKVSEGDSETHWVACKTTDDCPGAQVCEARVCVEPKAAGAGGSGSAPSGSGGTPTSGSGGSPASGSGSGPGGGAGPWACLGQPSTTEDGVDTSMDFALNNILGGRITDAEATLCLMTDVGCAAPVSPPVASDDTGLVTLTVPGSFFGYALFTSASAWPSLYVIGRSSYGGAAPKTVQFASANTVAALSGAIGSPQLDGNGLVTINVRDCSGKPGPGVRFVFDSFRDTPVPFFAIGSIPDKDAVETDASGFGGFVNVLPGTLSLRAVLNDGTERVVGTTRVVVHANALTVATIAPGDL